MSLHCSHIVDVKQKRIHFAECTFDQQQSIYSSKWKSNFFIELDNYQLRQSIQLIEFKYPFTSIDTRSISSKPILRVFHHLRKSPQFTWSLFEQDSLIVYHRRSFNIFSFFYSIHQFRANKYINCHVLSMLGRKCI